MARCQHPLITGLLTIRRPPHKTTVLLLTKSTVSSVWSQNSGCFKTWFNALITRGKNIPVTFTKADVTKDLGHFWLCYIRIYRNPGTLGIDCSLSQLCTALELHCLNRHEKIGQGCGMQMLTIWFFIGTLVWKVSQILDMIDCTKLSCSPVYRVANIHDKESQF